MELRAPQQGTSLPRPDRQKHQRFPVLWWGQIEVGIDRQACLIYDLSVGGAKVRTSRRGTVGQPVSLVMPPFGGFKGKVVWTRDRRIGVQFADDEYDCVAGLIASRLKDAPGDAR